jgi:hypothetical protein
MAHATPAVGLLTATLPRFALLNAPAARAAARRAARGRSKDWLKLQNPAAPAVKREAEEDWGRGRWQ